MNSYKQYIDSNDWEFVPYEETPTMKSGGMIKRADGSYSKKGLWDNIRANKGSGKKPTKEMLTQEKKINKLQMGGNNLPIYSPEQEYKKGGLTKKESHYLLHKGQVYNKDLTDKQVLKFYDIFHKKQMGGPTEYDTIPSYLNYIKAKQIHNEQGANDALKHIGDVRGAQTMNDMRFLGDGLKNSNINSLAKTRLPNEQNPQMKLLYSQIEQNPQLVDNFQYFMPENKSMVKFQKGGPTKPIVVNNPNDPRLRAYQDSTTLYNIGEKAKKVLYSPTTTYDSWAKYMNDNQPTEHKIVDDANKSLLLNAGSMGLPTGRSIRKFDTGLIDKFFNNQPQGSAPIYQKPVQPVVYQPSPQQNTSYTNTSSIPNKKGQFLVRDQKPINKQSNPKEFIKYFDDEGQYNKAVRERGDSLNLFNGTNKDLSKMYKRFDFMQPGPILSEKEVIKVINDKNPKLEAHQRLSGRLNSGKFNFWESKDKKSATGQYTFHEMLDEYKKRKPNITNKPVGWQVEMDSSDSYKKGELYDYNAVYKKPVMIPKLRQQEQPLQRIPTNTVGRDVDLNYSAPPNLQMTPSQGMPLKTYTMQGKTPVYGGANSLMGMLDNNNTFYPDYNNTAKRTGVNQADSDMLNNPEAMTKYLQDKGVNNPNIQKFQFGGSTYRNQMMDYLFNQDDDDEETPKAVAQNTAPSVEDVQQEQQASPAVVDQNELAMSAAMQGMEENPYTSMKNKYTKDRLSPELQNILGITTQMFPGLKVTSTTRGIHLKRSAHYDGEAGDIGANSSNAVDYKAFKAALPSLSKQLGFKYIDEKNHIHLSKSTKGKI